MPLHSHTSDPIKRLSSLFRTIPFTAMPHHLHAFHPIQTLDRPFQPEDQRQGFHHKSDGQHHDDDEKKKKKHRKRICKEPSSGLRNCKPMDEEAEPRESSSETLNMPSSVLPSKNSDLQGSSSTTRVDDRDESKEPNGPSNMEIVVRETVQGAQNQTEDRLALSICPTPLSAVSPSFATQSSSSVPSSILPEQRLSPQSVNNVHVLGAGKKNSSGGKVFSAVNVARASASDGYNWRKYGQKQVKSPTGFRSYYRCTHSGCSAKKIEFCDHSGHMIEIIYKGHHSHEPLRKNTTNTTGEIKFIPFDEPTAETNLPEKPIGVVKEADPSSSTKEPVQVLLCSADKKRQNSSGHGDNGKVMLKVEHVDEPELKRRVKNDDLTNLDLHVEHGKKSKYVVHQSGDVGISGDGYRWRKYGQKMVRGNSHPRNYYRCTSAGCPVRKQIETAVDDPNAVIITYKGAHNHDKPVPKKRHGPPSAPHVAATAPASSNNLQLMITDSQQNQENSAQWSVDSDEELTEDASDLGGEKAIESARTLLSMGEIKPC